MPADPSPAVLPPLLALRAEGGPGRGVGHLARCLALAEAWVARGGAAALVTSALPAPWDERARRAGVDVASTADALHRVPDWWVVDGYDLGAEGAPPAARLARIDDAGRSPALAAEVVIDQNLGASAGDYPEVPGQLLLGPRYALLRRDLVDGAVARGADRGGPGPTTAPQVARLAIAMGGSPAEDVRAFFEQVVLELAADDLSIQVLRGDGDPAEVLAGATVAVAPAGSTCWELALYGVPSVLVTVADNQVPLARALGQRGAAVDLGDLRALAPAAVADEVRRLVASHPERAALAERIGALVDGRGAGRVATRLRSALLELRSVGPEDARVVHALNDDPTARAMSSSSEPIPWADHERWFSARLADPASHLYLAHDASGGLVGLVRFQVDARVATTGVVVDPVQRGRGWAAPLIDAGVRRLAGDLAVRSPGTERISPLVRVDALVKPENRASARAFLDADFDPAPADGPEVLRYARVHGIEVGI